MNYWRESKENVYVAAHRGWSEAYPENTMEAFRAAVDLGVDQIETDVRVTKDGELVLIHDAAVDRTTDGSGAVIDMTLAELKKLDAGIRKGEQFKGCRVPTLTELLDYARQFPLLTLDLELKEYPTEGREQLAFDVCDRILKLVDEYGFTDRVVINSFSGRLNEYVRQKHGDKYRQHVFYPQSCLGECTVDPYSYAYCCCMFGDNSPIASKEVCGAMAARGVEPWAGAGIKTEADVDLMLQCGATLVTCNNPDEILKWLRQKGRHE